MLEKQIEARLNKMVKEQGGMSLKFISTISGVPDRIVLLNSKLSFVELKTETGKLSKRQEIVFDQLGEQGFPVHVLRSIDDVEDFICEAIRPACVPETPNQSGEIHPELGTFSATWLREDDDIIDDTGGSV